MTFFCLKKISDSQKRVSSFMTSHYPDMLSSPRTNCNVYYINVTYISSTIILSTPSLSKVHEVACSKLNDPSAQTPAFNYVVLSVFVMN